MKILAVVSARLTSKILPGKTLMPILDVPMIELLIQRLSFSKNSSIEARTARFYPSCILFSSF